MKHETASDPFTGKVRIKSDGTFEGTSVSVIGANEDTEICVYSLSVRLDPPSEQHSGLTVATITVPCEIDMVAKSLAHPVPFGDRFSMLERGWRDGADGQQGMEHPNDPDYTRAFELGRGSRKAALDMLALGGGFDLRPKVTFKDCTFSASEADVRKAITT